MRYKWNFIKWVRIRVLRYLRIAEITKCFFKPARSHQVTVFIGASEIFSNKYRALWLCVLILSIICPMTHNRSLLSPLFTLIYVPNQISISLRSVYDVRNKQTLSVERLRRNPLSLLREEQQEVSNIHPTENRMKSRYRKRKISISAGFLQCVLTRIFVLVVSTSRFT